MDFLLLTDTSTTFKYRHYFDNAPHTMTEGVNFDIIFLDADKENYQAYYDLALDEGLLADDGIIMADNVLCALLYDKSDFRSQKLHEFIVSK